MAFETRLKRQTNYTWHPNNYCHTSFALIRLVLWGVNFYSINLTLFKLSFTFELFIYYTVEIHSTNVMRFLISLTNNNL